MLRGKSTFLICPNKFSPLFGFNSKLVLYLRLLREGLENGNSGIVSEVIFHNSLTESVETPGVIIYTPFNKLSLVQYIITKYLYFSVKNNFM